MITFIVISFHRSYLLIITVNVIKKVLFQTDHIMYTFYKLQVSKNIFRCISIVRTFSQISSFIETSCLVAGCISFEDQLNYEPIWFWNAEHFYQNKSKKEVEHKTLTQNLKIERIDSTHSTLKVLTQQCSGFDYNCLQGTHVSLGKCFTTFGLKMSMCQDLPKTTKFLPTGHYSLN